MALLFTPEELFNIAAQLEAGGQAYYLELAGSATDAKVRELYDMLATQEEQHYKLFTDMYHKASGVKTAPAQVDPETASYVESLLDMRLFRRSTDGREKAMMSKSLREALTDAIQFEKDSLLFFAELAKLVGKELCAPINALINEERKHIIMLKGFLDATP